MLPGFRLVPRAVPDLRFFESCDPYRNPFMLAGYRLFLARPQGHGFSAVWRVVPNSETVLGRIFGFISVSQAKFLDSVFGAKFHAKSL